MVKRKADLTSGAPRKQQRSADDGQQRRPKQQQRQRQPKKQKHEPEQPSVGPPAMASNGSGADAATFKNKEKVLLLCTRGVTFRYRHLMTDLLALLPHGKKDNKLDTKNDRGVINEVADMKGCSNVLFFEVRKRTDLYLWLAKSPAGPAVKFLVQNVHTMSELKLTGNHLRGSRPVLSFDPQFDQQPHWQLLKEMLTQAFTTPKRHHKSKPFFDHVISFSIVDGRIWFRNYQVVVPLDKKKADASSTSLVEVGPRFAMQPIKLFAGSFGGATMYENPAYVSPNAIRQALKRRKGGKYKGKVAQKARRREHESANVLPEDELGNVFRE